MGRIYEYQGDEITVSYDLKRCIHAKECVHGLPDVFDPERKPWIDPAGAGAEEVAAVVERCPTGALQYRGKDGVSPETPPEASIRIEPSGPLYVEGRIEIMDSEGAVRWTDTRIALCRCGASKNKPFCDNSHKDIEFSTEAPL